MELPINNCPPTAFTVSFSNTAVDNVPRILAFPTSKNPLSNAVSLTPLPLPAILPDEKSADSIVPSLFSIKFPPLSVVVPIVQPAISFENLVERMVKNDLKQSE